MKIPLHPPSLPELLDEITQSANGQEQLLDLIGSSISRDPAGNYIHWDKLRYLDPPSGYTHREWWFAIKSARLQQFQDLPFKDTDGRPFVLAVPDQIQQKLHVVDRNASGRIEVPEAVTNPQTRDRFLVRSLMEEAITSSQLEGASTTLRDAKAMIRERRKPVDRSQQMILNNYYAMQFIRDNSHQNLTRELLLELHSILMDKTLTDEGEVGRWRRSDEDVKVVDPRDNTVLHIPPNADEIDDRIQVLCNFANENSPQPFIHPVIRAILVHFALAYDHPFVDGNGRTARALFYWCMSRLGYWMIEFTSISTILKKAPSKYARSYLYVETDSNDTTYFVNYQLEVIERSIRELHEYIARKAREIRVADKWMRSSARLRKLLNHRQVALLMHALKHPYQIYTVRSHMHGQQVTYETARSDLQKLSKEGLLEQITRGRTYEYHVPDDLKDRLDGLQSKP